MNGKEYRLYFSHRHLPLLYVDLPPCNRSVLTLENYCKWYGFYAVWINGYVEEIDHDAYEALIDPTEVWCFDDGHCPDPAWMLRIAEHLGMELDHRAWETAYGRAHVEYDTWG